MRLALSTYATLVAAVTLTTSTLASCGSKNGNSFGDAGVDADFANNCGHADCDGDGYAKPADCNDNDPMVNPEAYDFPNDGIDNDCNGAADDPVETCETIPAQSPGSPTDFVRAADMCQQKSKTNDGTIFDPLVHAEWGKLKGYGPGQRLWTSETKMQQVNIVSSFGDDKPRRGQTMFGLSNGPWGTRTPRESAPLDDPAFKLNDACADIPLTGADCTSLSNGASAGGLSVQDWAELAVTVKVPSNVQTMVFDFSFFSTEFNQFWNAALNDAFFVLVTSQKLAGTNVAKDANGLAITVNSGFFQLCAKAPGPPGLSPDKSAALASCVGIDGDASKSVFGSLKSTGFDGAGSNRSDGTALSQDGTKTYVYGGGSGWLTAKFAVVPREVLTMRIIVHDTFDGLKDSAVLFDALRWERDATSGGVQRPPR